MYMGKLEEAATGEEIREWMYRGRRVVLTLDLLSDTSAALTFDCVDRRVRRWEHKVYPELL